MLDELAELVAVHLHRGEEGRGEVPGDETHLSGHRQAAADEDRAARQNHLTGGGRGGPDLLSGRDLLRCGRQRVVRRSEQRVARGENDALDATRTAITTATVLARTSLVRKVTRPRRTYPTPRTVWMLRGSPPSSSLPPQVADVDGERVRPGVEVEAPHAVEDHLAREHLSGVAQEHLEEVEFDAGQGEGALAPLRLPGGQVEGEVADAEPPTLPLEAAAQQSPQAGQQLGQGERFDQIVVGAGIEPGHAVVDGVAGRDMSTGVSSPTLRMRRQTVSPSRSGSPRSRTSASGGVCASASSASPPVGTVVTS